jgi:hypothetical protein
MSTLQFKDIEHICSGHDVLSFTRKACFFPEKLSERAEPGPCHSIRCNGPIGQNAG